MNAKKSLKTGLRAVALLAAVGASAVMAAGATARNADQGVSMDQVNLVHKDTGTGGHDRGGGRGPGNGGGGDRSISGSDTVTGGDTISGHDTIGGECTVAGNCSDFLGEGNIAGDGNVTGNNILSDTVL